jgi:hypothetical protein
MCANKLYSKVPVYGLSSGIYVRKLSYKHLHSFVAFDVWEYDRKYVMKKMEKVMKFGFQAFHRIYATMPKNMRKE